jgi:hypothetical protein
LTELKSALKSRYFEIAIAVTFVVLLLYLISAAVRVSRGVSRTEEPPEHQVRLQILNGCGETGLAGRIADRMDGYRDGDFGIIVVDTDNFETLDIDSSFVISRTNDKSTAKMLAERLGLNGDDIVFVPLEANHRQVSATLVLGRDYERLTVDLR